MVEHQPRLLGSRVRFPAGAFAIFSVSAKASLPVSLPHFPFLFLSLPLPFLSSSFPFDLSFALKMVLVTRGLPPLKVARPSCDVDGQ